MKPVELSFSPVDNERLANLCGALDENLRQIETALEVSIVRRGENFSVNGSPDQSRYAAKALKHFYEQAAQHLGIEDIQLGLIEVVRGSNVTVPTPDSPVLQTRRRELHGRTPRQVQYIKQIQVFEF